MDNEHSIGSELEQIIAMLERSEIEFSICNETIETSKGVTFEFKDGDLINIENEEF